MHKFRNTPYSVSTDGQVFREGKTKPLSPDVGVNGYHRVTLSIEGKTERFLVHRMVAEVYLANPEGKPDVNHLDNDRSNNVVKNLEWCTHPENMLHSHRQGRCSNIIASQKASANKTEKTAALFKERLGDLFIEVVNKNPRNFVKFKCASCLRLMECRIDSSLFKLDRVTCRYCV